MKTQLRCTVRVLPLLVLLALPSAAPAQKVGFFLPEQVDGRNTAIGRTTIAAPIRSSSIFSNPAGLVMLNGRHMRAGGHLFLGKLKVDMESYGMIESLNTASLAASPSKAFVPALVTSSTASASWIRSPIAQPAGEITLQKSFFKPVRYAYSDGEPQKVFTFSGLSFHDGFEEVMSQHPQALNAAGQARLYNGVALGGSLLIAVGGFQMLQSSLDQVDAVNQGNLYAADESLKGVGTMLAGAVVMIVGNVLSSTALKRGVRMFNERQRVQADTARRAAVNAPEP